MEQNGVRYPLTDDQRNEIEKHGDAPLSMSLAATLIGVQRSAVYNAAQRGRLKARLVVVGGQNNWEVLPRDLLEYCDSRP